MSNYRVYGVLAFIVVLRESTGFLGPALRAGGRSLGQTRDLQPAGGWDSRAALGDVRVPCFRPPLGRKCRGGVSMMAKKRRRRRVEQAAPDVPPTASAAPELKTGEQGVGVEEQVQDAVAVDEEEEEDVDSSGAVVMPPLPSELGLDAVRVSQELQGEDMMSPATYQPKPEVADVEMIDGGVGGGLMDEPARKKKTKYSFDLNIDLPMESESRGAGTRSPLPDAGMSPDGVMPLPDFRDLAKKPRKKDRQKDATEVEQSRKVERGNVAAFTKLLELDPEADSEEGLFTSESYDAFSSVLGEGKPFVGIPNSYLQSGHTVLLVLTLLCGFIELPGFPLTSLPYDVREFLKTGLLVVYAINSAIAYLSYLEAKRVGQPPAFWAVKGFILGGLAFNELSLIEPRKSKVAKGARQRRG